MQFKEKERKKIRKNKKLVQTGPPVASDSSPSQTSHKDIFSSVFS